MLQITLCFIMENNICTYDPRAFRHFHNGYCKTVISGTCDPLALNGKCGLHL